MNRQKKGNPYGTHRVIEPKGVLPQAAKRVNNDFSTLFDNEILCDVHTLNIDAASFAEIKERGGWNPERIETIMREIVHSFGKHKNPVTGSGGMFIGEVIYVGEALKGKISIQEGDLIASLVSLSLTPLRIDTIKNIHLNTDQVEIVGQAVLFEHSVYAKLPKDMPPSLALAVLDVAGAPAQVDRLVTEGDTVAVIGARGKSGLLCCYQAKKRGGPTGKVIAIIHKEEGRVDLDNAPFIDEVVVGAADKGLDLLEKVSRVTQGKLCDIVVNCVSQNECEVGSVLITRTKGKVYFFSMATSFTKAALGAEGIGKDVEMIIGNGFCEGHADLTLDLLRESEYIRSLYTKRYGER